MGKLGTKKRESWYSETERLISRYCWDQERLSRLRTTEQALREDIDELNQSLVDMKRIPGITAKYGLTPGGARGSDPGYMTLMEQYETQTDALIKQLLNKSRRLASIRHRIYEIKERSAPFDAAMSRLTMEESNIIEHRYIYRRSNYQIAGVMHCSEYRIRYMLNKVVVYMAGWLKIKSNRKVIAS